MNIKMISVLPLIVMLFIPFALIGNDFITKMPIDRIRKSRDVEWKLKAAIMKCAMGEQEAFPIIAETISEKQLDICDTSFTMGFTFTSQTLNNVLYMYTGTSFIETQKFLTWWDINKDKTPDEWVRDSINKMLNDDIITPREKAHIFRFTCNADIFYDNSKFKIWWKEVGDQSQEKWLLSAGNNYVKYIEAGSKLKPLYSKGFNNILKYGGRYNIGPKLYSIVPFHSYKTFVKEYWEFAKKNYKYSFIERLTVHPTLQKSK
jgi:hypothetical protein